MVNYDNCLAPPSHSQKPGLNYAPRVSFIFFSSEPKRTQIIKDNKVSLLRCFINFVLTIMFPNIGKNTVIDVPIDYSKVIDF